VLTADCCCLLLRAPGAADETTTLKVSCWNGACTQFFTPLDALPLGTLVAITGYKLKRDLTTGGVEVAVNYRGPTGRIYVLDETGACTAI